MSSNEEKLMEDQHRHRIEENSQRAAVQATIEDEQRRVKNPEFLKQLQDPDADTEVWDWVESEFGPLFSGAHILGQRSESYEEQQELLNRNVVKRMEAEGTPGRLLRENPRMLAQAQGLTGTEEYPDPTENPEFREPLSSRDKRAIRNAAEILTTRQTLSIGGRGVDAVSTATVENRTVTNEETEARGIKGRAKKVFE